MSRIFGPLSFFLGGGLGLDRDDLKIPVLLCTNCGPFVFRVFLVLIVMMMFMERVGIEDEDEAHYWA